MSRIKIKIDRTKKRFRLKSPVKNIDIPVKKIVCRTTRIPSVNRLRDLYRKSFENPKNIDDQIYIKDHLLHISSNQTRYDLDDFKKDIRLINKRLNQKLIHRRKYKKSPNRIVFFIFYEQSQDKELTHCHILLRVPKFLKNKIKKLVRIIEKHLPPLFSVRLTKRTQQISVKYPTKRTHELNDNFDVY